jgi:hypothetical protein
MAERGIADLHFSLHPFPNGRVEKYRPLKLDDVVGNRATIERLKVIEHEGNCPHLMISVSTTLLSRELHT